MNRRDWITITAGTLAAAALARLARAEPARATPWFQISLAEWSLHRAIRSGAMAHLDFPRVAKEDHGITAVEYVSTLFKHKHDSQYVADLRKRCDDLGVSSLLIMIDGEGALGDPDDAARAKAVQNHVPWLQAAKALGCHSIRVNAESKGPPDEQSRLAADGLRRLCEHADPLGLNVIVENHWGLSSEADWLMDVMRRVDHPRVGTLPDFGNFDPKVQDRYDGVRAMMPLARGVSAKSYDFDPASGDETKIDFRRMLSIVRDAGYRGHIGIEYEGSSLSESDGIRATMKLLERLRTELAPQGETQ